jgi:hypothetical protein
MPSYISSNANRFYVALESGYGQVAAVTADNRIPALKMTVQQRIDNTERRDKTGSRTYTGMPPGGRTNTQFEVDTYLTSWDKTKPAPAYGPLVQAALGAPPLAFQGANVSSATTDGQVSFAAPHGLVSGQAVESAGEIRFVAAVLDLSTVQLNAPFVTTPASGAILGITVTYTPATELPSVSIYDRWSPATAVQRLLRGSAVDQMDILVNGDFHEVHFSGPAQDVLDSASFTSGQAGLEAFPEEPALDSFDYSIVPGNLGQAWIGATASRFCTITSASIRVKNNLDIRTREFGGCAPRSFAPGSRVVTVALELFSKDDDATAALYQAARQESPISVMFQLGETDSQVMGVYLKSVIPEVPEFDDTRNRLQWKFRQSRAQGTVDDEIAVAFA